MIPQMAKRGYDRDYAVNVTVNAAIIALMIPPSHNMILYSIAAGGNDAPSPTSSPPALFRDCYSRCR